MRLPLLTAATLGLLVAACGQSDDSPPPRSISVRSEAQEQLHRLSEMNLKIALRRALYASGRTCQTVTEAGYVQEYGNLSMWTASCNNGARYAIFVGPDASAQVRPCAEMEQLKLPTCEIRKKPAPG